MTNLIKIQSELKSPKNQKNNFGNYRYRSCEDVLEAVKPLLAKYGCTLTISDKMKTVNAITFVESTCTFKDGENVLKVKASAGIEPQKGMTLAQCFGSSSSYARKYALNGLFLIDDTKDSDATNTHGNEPKTGAKVNISTPEQSEELAVILKAVKECKSIDDIKMLWDSLDATEQAQTKAIFTKRKQELA